ncbi:MAG: PIN domain-containing protein [Microthrixaceae bacterium]
MIEDGEIATCAIVDLVILYSGRNLNDYESILEERHSFDTAPITPDVLDTAVDLQHELARRGRHRIPIPDLIISAAALHTNLVVLHYDSDFERLAEVGGAHHEWVIPQGSL